MPGKLKTKRDFSCGGVIWDEETQKVLLVRVKNLSNAKVWTFPKGHPEGQESDEETAIREVREETGWTCEVVKPLLDVHYSYVDKSVKYNKTVRWFFMAPKEKVGEFDPKEILDAKWFDLNETKRLITYESDAKLLKRLALLT